MKWRPDVRSVGLGLVAGSLAGGLCGYVLARSAARREYETRLETAIAEIKKHYSRPLLGSRLEEAITELDLDTLVPGRTRYKDVIKQTLDGETRTFSTEPVLDPLEGLNDGSDGLDADDEGDGGISAGEGSQGNDGLRDLGPVPEEEWDEPPGPFELSEAQFGELLEEGFQTISVTYYAGDKTLCDDKDEPIRDIEGTVGVLSPLGFGGVSGDPQIRYVRNRRLQVDFEILLKDGSFADEVLGYGDPARQKKARSRAKAAG